MAEKNAQQGNTDVQCDGSPKASFTIQKITETTGFTKAGKVWFKTCLFVKYPCISFENNTGLVPQLNQ